MIFRFSLLTFSRYLRFVVIYVSNVSNVIYVTFVFLENSFIYYICVVLFTPVFCAVRSPRLDSSVG